MDHQYRQRPPSARPGTRQQQNRPGTTSSTYKRPKTAGRSFVKFFIKKYFLIDSERPPSSLSSSIGQVPPSRQMSRPQSRIGMVANSVIAEAPPRVYSRTGNLNKIDLKKNIFYRFSN
jgi:hypothetical protein